MSETNDAADRFLSDRAAAARAQHKQAMVERLKTVHIKLSVVVASMEAEPTLQPSFRAAFVDMRDVIRDVLLWVQEVDQ